MKKYTLILIILSTLVLVSSCTKQLDLEPKQSLIADETLTTDDNVKSALVGAYVVFRSPSLYGGIILRNAELFANQSFKYGKWYNEIYWVGTFNAPDEIYYHQIIPANGDITQQWLDSYKCINTCNNVLSALNVVVEDDRAQVEGEALFLRSLMYFDLLRFFANSYVPGIANSQLGVPLKLTPSNPENINEPIGRSSVDAVYNKVIEDLEKAATVLPEENAYYATWGAAKALLSRVYLQKGDFIKARDAANELIDSGLYELNEYYHEAFNNIEYSREDIFAAKFTPADGVNQMTEFWSTTDFGGRDGDIEIDTTHLHGYDVDDDRRNLFWDDDSTFYSGKWNTKYGLVNIFRLAEIYLIRAECNIRLGTSVGAAPVDDYNMTHTRAGLPAATAVTLDDILYERRLELAHEGFKFHDAKRLQIAIDGYPYDDPYNLFPIPQREMDGNSGLAGQQNPGYE